MKAKDWQSTAKLIRERQSQAATADSSELSSFPLSELSVDDSGPPTVLQGTYVALSTSTPIRMPQGNQQIMDSAPDESPFQQVIPSITFQEKHPDFEIQPVNTIRPPEIEHTPQALVPTDTLLSIIRKLKHLIM